MKRELICECCDCVSEKLTQYIGLNLCSDCYEDITIVRNNNFDEENEEWTLETIK